VRPAPATGHPGRAVDDLVEEVVHVAGRAYSLLRPRDVDAIVADLVAAGVGDDARLPFWAALWPAGAALAEVLARTPLGGRRVLDLGCGLGLAAVVAAAGGAEVLAVDRCPEAVERTAANAARNGVRLHAALGSLDEPGPLAVEGAWDVVLVGDLLYDQANVAPLRRLLARLVGDDAGEVWLADPGRPALGPFLRAVDGDGWRRERLAAPTPAVGLWRLRSGAAPEAPPPVLA